MGGIEEKDPLLVNNFVSGFSFQVSGWPVFGFLFPVTCFLSPNFGYLGPKKVSQNLPKAYFRGSYNHQSGDIDKKCLPKPAESCFWLVIAARLGYLDLKR